MAILNHLVQWAFPIAVIAALVQVVDQLLVKTKIVGPIKSGGGWIAFQAWAIYFLGGSVLIGGPSEGGVNGGLGAFVAYVLAIIGSIAIFELGGVFSKLGFWATPLSLLILVTIIIYLMIAPWPFCYVPALFVGAGVFFGIMSYFPQIPGSFPEGASKWSNYLSAAVGELVYCLVGLAAGWLTVFTAGVIGTPFGA
jgi:hypothetical protein